jgi:hypothetical protein
MAGLDRTMSDTSEGLALGHVLVRP